MKKNDSRVEQSHSSSSSRDRLDQTEIGWAQIGENAATLLGMARRGDRERAVASLAYTYDTYDNRIRKCVGAYEFVISVGDKRLQRLLPAQPLSLVDLIVLWASHDRQGALTAAAELIDGKHTFQSLRAAERAARPKTVSTVASRAAAWRDAATAALIKGVARGFKDVGAPENVMDAPADLWLVRRDLIIGVQLIGPYPHHRDYNRNAPYRTFASLGIAHLGFGSWIALPVDTAGQRYKEIAERIAPGVLKIVELEMPAFTEL